MLSAMNSVNEFSPEKASQEIEHFLQERIEHLQRNGAVLALSGGLDSSVTAALTVRALGPEKVTLLNMPEQDSSPVHQQHARQFAKMLGAEFVVYPITSLLQAAGTYQLLPLHFIPGRGLRAWVVSFAKKRLERNRENNFLADRLRPPKNGLIARGTAYATAKHRIRVVVLYQFAEANNLMVVGAANRTEWLTGTFSKWGVDHCADAMPVLHVYRSQLEKLASYLELPRYLLNKPADPDVMPGVNNKGALLGDIALIDEILYSIEQGMGIEELKINFPAEDVEKLIGLQALSAHMRAAPYYLE
jgi:NAD+ synthase